MKNNRAISVRVAHINDTHSYFEPTSLQLNVNNDETQTSPYVSAGGFARIKTRVEELRAESSQQKHGFLFFHAGDCFQGTLFYSLFKGEANSTLLNQLGLDAMAVGNHELDMGNLPVAEFANRIDFPLLAGNWDLSRELKDKPVILSGNPNVYSYKPSTQSAQWIVKHVEQEPIAIFALALDKMADISNPDADTPFVNAIETARNTVNQIHKAGINKIILLSHMGYDADLDFANHVDGISLIVGGHSHVLQGDFSALGLGNNDPYGIRVNNTHVVQAGFHALALGHCDIDFDQDGVITNFSGHNELLVGRRLFVDTSRSQSWQESDYQALRDLLDKHPLVTACRKDPTIKLILKERYQTRVRELQQTFIATTKRKLRHVRIPDEKGGSDLAPLVAESFIHMMNKQGHHAQFAIHNAGGVRNSIDPGKISVADIAGKVLPFLVPIGVYKIKGQHISAIIEGAINNATNNGVEGTGSGSYPYVANLRYEYDATAPMGNRVSDLDILLKGVWQPVLNDEYYTGTSSAYTMKGKEGYEAILNMQGEGIVSNESMADCLIAYFTDKPKVLERKSQATDSKG